ncbi:MAG: hypothetical protein H7062_23310 [Candidatus Saccharimonas sp.]|nr:hypothetical protein [Planctomycetaceae bacterium]
MILLLDTGILGQLCHPSSEQNRAASDWLRAVLDDQIEHRVIVPEICDYELRRKLLHLIAKGQSTQRSIDRLDTLRQQLDFLPIDSNVMLKAAEFWCQARIDGQPTASNDALDGDVILAAQAAAVEGTVVTANLKHLRRFVPASDLHELHSAYAFSCVSGDVDNIALNRDECFAVQDSNGKSWLCRRIPSDPAEIVAEQQKDIDDIKEAQRKLAKAGFTQTGGLMWQYIMVFHPVPLSEHEQLIRLRHSLEKADTGGAAGER